MAASEQERSSSESDDKEAVTNRTTIIIVLGLTMTLASCSTTRVPTDAGGSMSGTVVANIDGDTLTIAIAGRRHDVRLIGVDTPETKHPTKPVECGGPEAAGFTAGQFPVGTKVRIVRDVEARDRFGRLLGYLYRHRDGLFLNRALLEMGYARVLHYEPNTTHAVEFDGLALDAKRRGLGIWAHCGG